MENFDLDYRNLNRTFKTPDGNYKLTIRVDRDTSISKCTYCDFRDKLHLCTANSCNAYKQRDSSIAYNSDIVYVESTII